MELLKVDLTHIFNEVSKGQVASWQLKTDNAFRTLTGKTGKGNDFLGWIALPAEIDQSIFDQIRKDADRLREKSDILVVIGIGGSYLGARAVIEALGHSFPCLEEKRKDPLIIYAGHHLSEEYLSDLIEILDKKEYSLVVISKSGTTTEPAIAFRILRDHIEKKYGIVEARTRIIAITDKSKGALKKLADEQGYASYVVPDDVGGRYSVLTPVGLLPIAAAGFDIRELLRGAKDFMNAVTHDFRIFENPVATYAAARNALYKAGKEIEIMVSYQPHMSFFTEWWKQLYGESEGKEGKGLFPAGVNNTTDLHSMGQYIQEGSRILFETVLSVNKSKRPLTIPYKTNDADQLNYISGKTLQYVNQMAELGTTLAHVDGQVPNIRIEIPALTEYYIGQLIYFFELACGISGYLLEINPFDQPGVEAYKKNMFALLGKPGFEKETEEIRNRIKK